MYAARMAYCGPRGIPLSTFLDWDDSDQEAALAWAAHEGRRCPSCRTHPNEWDEEAGGHRDAYSAEMAICPGCRTLEHERRRAKDSAPPGAHLILRPAPREVARGRS